MAEIGPNETLYYLSRLVMTSLDQTEEFWKTLGPESRLAPMLEPTSKLTTKTRSGLHSYLLKVMRPLKSTKAFATLLSYTSVLLSLLTYFLLLVMRMDGLLSVCCKH